MDDINLIRTVLVDEVDDDHRAAARLRLLDAIATDGVATKSPQRRLRWSLIGAGVAAAGVATVVALGTGSVAPTGPPSGTQVEAAPETAQQFLLAAATQAERAPATSGKYWHVRWVQNWGNESDRETRVIEQWQAADPRQQSWWGVGEFVDGRFTPSLDKVKRVGYGWEEEFSPAEIRNLPTDPAALRSALEAKRKKNATEPGPTGDDYLFAATAGLLARAPATPAQMAAGYRLLASLPGVELGGTATDSEGRTGMLVRRSDHRTGGSAATEHVELIIDRETYQVLATRDSLRITDRGRDTLVRSSQSVYTQREWTDREPTEPTPPAGTPTR